ncbi:MAG: 16S rRNA (guanine(527)-N(7))-methyltransferase RsmG [Candidatus Margulisiibacteriota bacterium]
MNDQFDIYQNELIEWNAKFNLTAITEPDEIRKKHFEDSLLLLQVLPLTGQAVVDIGAGAGFPGIPLKIVCPGIKLTLLEATRKKVGFLDHLIKTLSLKETEAVWARAEEYAEKNREKFDLAVARAVAKLDTLCGYCLPLVKAGGIFVAYKQVEVDAEVEEAARAIAILGGRLREIRKFPARSLVLIDKIAPSPVPIPPAGGDGEEKAAVISNG